MQSGFRPDVTQRLNHAIEHARHLLPAQGPIGTFIHHNTLHAFQHLPFHDAIRAASDMFGARGYLDETRYRKALATGRITGADLDAVLAKRARSVPDRRIGRATLRDIERLILTHGIHSESARGLRWIIDEREVTRTLRPDLPIETKEHLISRTTEWMIRASDDRHTHPAELLGPEWRSSDLASEIVCDPERTTARALWSACRVAASRSPRRGAGPKHDLLARVGRDRTHRDLVVALGAPDPAQAVNDVLIPFLASYLDEGIARWPMPGRERGLLACFCDYESAFPSVFAPWRRRALERLRAASKEGRESPRMDAAHVVISALHELDVHEEHWDAYLTRVLLELPGWNGMVARLESHPDDRGPNAPPASLLELAAIRLALEVEALRESALAIGHRGPCSTLPSTLRAVLSRSSEHDQNLPWRLFQLCQLLGIAAPDLLAAPESEALASNLVGALDSFEGMTLLETFHDAYEHHHQREQLAAISDNIRSPAYPEPTSARFQVAFCIDDREEAIRRHFEELDPRHITLAVAGFYGVAMRFRAIDDLRAQALCPAVISPNHVIEEQPHPDHASWAEKRSRLRARLATLQHTMAHSSHSLARGAMLTPVLGLVLAFPLSLRMLFPRAAASIANVFTRRLLPPPRSRLAVTRHHEAAHDGAALIPGFTLEECATIVRTTLESMGLVKGFAPLVVVLGHGATSANNPHFSAYNCGACGGQNGGPNARAFAAMANDRAVRSLLREAGFDLPETTHFIGGVHDTTSEDITLFDLDLVPPSLASELVALESAFKEARARSAHERCRRFEHAPARLDSARALAHVEERAVDLAQARPELGHATNAVCVVGRRALTRGLFLDRRALLVSYDPAIDPDGAILARVLAAAIPVCAGINLEYFFSTVDDEVWGSGSKLPHNLASLLGVMEGSTGDLRTGLPRQMIEVHEPVRLLSLIEASPERLLEILEANRGIGELVRNSWIRLVSVDGVTGAMSIFGPNGFEPFDLGEASLPRVEESLEWYAGKSDFIAPARIEPKATGSREAA
jgi:uncharacterized protein YbcC (UPF0753/DUF2309 family)